jgi:hypothetical protein
MHILILSQFIPPTIGGKERHVADLSSELVSRRHHISVVTLRQPGFPIFKTKHEVGIHCLSGTIQGLLADPVRRECMGNAAKQHAAAFQAVSVVAQIEHAYQEVLTSCAV